MSDVVDLLHDILIADLADRSGYSWDPTAARYRDLSTGRFVSEASLVSLAENYFDSFVRRNIEGITNRFLDGRIDLPRWQELMAREIKDSHITMAQLGRGGRSSMTFSDYGKVGSRIRQEYKYLNQFALEIKTGTMSKEEIMARAKLYARGSIVSYWDGVAAAKDAAGYNEERRVLHPAEHCTDCVGYANEGWKPVGYFPPPGWQSKCMHNCHCTKEYRRVEGFQPTLPLL